MPTYQYACTECGHDFEAVQSFSDDALAECPVCHGRLRKVFGAVGIVFKGSGFYRNDSRDKKPAGFGAKTDGKVDATSDSKADSTAGSTTESTKSDVTASSSKGTSGKDSGSSKPASTTSSTSSTKGSAA